MSKIMHKSYNLAATTRFVGTEINGSHTYCPTRAVQLEELWRGQWVGMKRMKRDQPRRRAAAQRLAKGRRGAANVQPRPAAARAAAVPKLAAVPKRRSSVVVALPAGTALCRAHTGSTRLGDAVFGFGSSRLELLPAELLASVGGLLQADFSALLALQGTSRALRRLAAEQVLELHWGRMGHLIAASGFHVRGLVRAFPRVRTLQLDGCAQVCDGLCGIVARHAPSLTALSLAGCAALSDSGLALLTPTGCGEGCGLPRLRCLDLSQCGGLSSAGLTRSLARLPALSSLRLQQCGALDDGALLALANAEECAGKYGGLGGGLGGPLPPWMQETAEAQGEKRQQAEVTACSELTALLGARAQHSAAVGGKLVSLRRRLSVAVQEAEEAGASAAAVTGGGGETVVTTFAALLPPPRRMSQQRLLPTPMAAAAAPAAASASTSMLLAEAPPTTHEGTHAHGTVPLRKACLVALDVSKCLGLSADCVGSLARMTALTTLSLAGCSRITSPNSRHNLASLLRPQTSERTSQQASVWGAARQTLVAQAGSAGLAPLRALTALTELDLSDCGGVRDVAWLAELRSLRVANLNGLEVLGGLAFLSPLHLARASMVGALQRTPRPSVVHGALQRPLLVPPMGALTDLSLHGCLLVGDDSLRQLRAVIAQLRRLCLHATGATTDAALSALFGRATALTDLDASKSGFGGQAAAALARAAPRLRRLRLRKCQRLTDEALRRLGATVGAHRELRVLDVSCCSQLTLFALGTLCAVPTQQLQQLERRGAVMRQQQQQLQLPAQQPVGLSMRSLDLSWLPRLEGNGSLSQLRQLRSLSLLGCVGIDDNTVLCLSRTTTLVSLNLKWCHQLTDAVIDGCFKRLPRLKVLNLKGCVEFSDSGMAQLSRLKTLTHLNVSLSSRLTYRGVALLRLLPNMEELLVSICEDSASHHM